MADVATSRRDENPSRTEQLIAHELELLRTRRQRLHERQDELRQRLRELDRALEELDARQCDLQRAITSTEAKSESVERAPQLVGGALRRRHAVAHLIATRQHDPIHYREWAKQLAAEGVVIRGVDPGATLLTNITRSPLITRAQEPGTYRLDKRAPERIQALVARARERLRTSNGLRGNTPDRVRRLRALVARLESAQAEIAECHRLARLRRRR
jgi:hypothetical protein